MGLTIERYLQSIKEKLSYLGSYIKSSNAAFRYNVNIFSEDEVIAFVSLRNVDIFSLIKCC